MWPFNIFKQKPAQKPKPKTLADYYPDWILRKKGDEIATGNGKFIFLSFSDEFIEFTDDSNRHYNLEEHSRYYFVNNSLKKRLNAQQQHLKEQKHLNTKEFYTLAQQSFNEQLQNHLNK